MEPQFGGKHFTVHFILVLLCCVLADEDKEIVKAREGATVTLKTKETKRNSNEQVLWTFGPMNPNVRIASVKKSEVNSDYNEHFRDRLQLDTQTGALTISQLRVSDTGVYKRQFISSNIISQHFHLIVYSSVRPPSIKVNASFDNKSCSSVWFECSVENSRDLILSWYRGRDRLKETSGPDLSPRLSLVLEVESHDEDDYSCVAENPVEEKATKLHREDTCPQNTESSSWCQTEATVLLVISAIIGMALIIVVVDHIRLRR
ncbi:hepatocyte cell adhesion molecule-like isoform X1 [Acanthopagrus latus]|uniref:hepatocyte cell adhesion molecule-like isoform X1 n=1 Tax=Acanthopagrus latus TaxID=8177 RepID=UPI00187C584C|nr:hepatocyte cell adhesion molecule-like isoform X1 [Acanthopagrus latus]